MIRARIFAACFACVLLFTSAALAEPETPSSRETSFQAVSGSTEEGVPGGSLMVGAYALLWLFIGLYLVPTRSLIHQVSTALQDYTRELSGSEATVLTIPQTPADASIESGIYVLTQERLQILLELAPELKFSPVVVDEAQTVAGDSRGIILQTVIDELRRRSPETQFLFSSPPSANPEIFGGLFGIGPTRPIEEEAQDAPMFLDDDDTMQ